MGFFNTINNLLSNVFSKLGKHALKVFLFVIITSSVLVIVIFTYEFYKAGLISTSLQVSPTISANYGDFVGGVLGSILALATVILVWVTYNSQKKELEETQKVLYTQQFESTYFSLLQTQRVLKKEVKATNKVSTQARLTRNKNLAGEDFFNHSRRELKVAFNALKGRLGIELENAFNFTIPCEIIIDGIDKKKIGDNPLKVSRLTYRLFFESFHPYLGHYFRFTYHILNFLKITKESERENSSISDLELENKYKNYADILQAQMNTDELFLLFYNGLLFKNAFDLINEFKFLDNLQEEELLDSKKHKNFYAFSLKNRNNMINKSAELG